MSRIGKLPISIPAGVTVAQDKDGVVTVKGPKGELTQKVDPSIKMTRLNLRLMRTALLILSRSRLSMVFIVRLLIIW